MKLLIYCAGGFGREVYDSAKRVSGVTGRWDEICFIDDDPGFGHEFYDARIFNFEAMLEEFDRDGIEALIATGEPVVRKLLYDKLTSNNVSMATVIDNSVILSDTAEIGAGVVITPHCTVSSLATIANNVVLNNKTIVGHDVKLGEHCVISSLVNLGGACTVGDNSYIGMGVQIKEGTKIGKDVIVGMGSVVYNDIPDEVIALGNPARPMRKNEGKRVFKGSNRRS